MEDLDDLHDLGDPSVVDVDYLDYQSVVDLDCQDGLSVDNLDNLYGLSVDDLDDISVDDLSGVWKGARTSAYVQPSYKRDRSCPYRVSLCP